MNYQFLHPCLQTLRNKPKWFFQNDDINGKLNCLEYFKIEGIPSTISILWEFLDGQDAIIQNRTAEIIVYLFKKLQSQNELYHSLKYIDINLLKLLNYRTTFSTDNYFYLLAIASFNHNGFIREKALKKLGEIGNPEAIIYILFRLSDWVVQVRNEAEEQLKEYLKAEYRNVFIQNFSLIELLLKVHRTNLANLHLQIVEFITAQELTPDFIIILKKFPDKERFIFLQYYLKFNQLNYSIASLIVEDKNFLVRNELLKHISQLDIDLQRKLIAKLLCDKSARVRVDAIYAAKEFGSEFDESIIKMASDKSGSVRSLVRFLFKNSKIDFAELYRQEILKNPLAVGALLGLGEVGSKDDIQIFQEHINLAENRIKFACLQAINKFDKELGYQYAVNFLGHNSKPLRNASIEILSKSRFNNLILTCRRLFEEGSSEQRKSLLRLFSLIGGWQVIGELIIALSDRDLEVQNLAWSSLGNWLIRRGKLFTTPSPEELQYAYEVFNKSKIENLNLNFHREALWKSIPFNLR